jgi:hypothetical protein
MLNVRKPWLPVVLACLLIGVIAMATQDDAKADTNHKVTITAASFTPFSGSANFQNDGFQLVNNFINGSGFYEFTAAVPILGDSAQITKLRLHFRDSGPEAVCAELRRAKPKEGNRKEMAQVCSGGSQTVPRSKSTTDISPSYVGPNHALHVALWLPHKDPLGPEYWFYGVTVFYTTP